MRTARLPMLRIERFARTATMAFSLADFAATACNRGQQAPEPAATQVPTASAQLPAIATPGPIPTVKIAPVERTPIKPGTVISGQFIIRVSVLEELPYGKDPGKYPPMVLSGRVTQVISAVEAGTNRKVDIRENDIIKLPVTGKMIEALLEKRPNVFGDAEPIKATLLFKCKSAIEADPIRGLIVEPINMDLAVIIDEIHPEGGVDPIYL